MLNQTPGPNYSNKNLYRDLVITTSKGGPKIFDGSPKAEEGIEKQKIHLIIFSKAVLLSIRLTTHIFGGGGYFFSISFRSEGVEGS